MNRLHLLPILLLLLIAGIFLHTSSVLAKQKPAAFLVEVADIEKSADLLNRLKKKGIPAALFPKNMQVVNEQTNRAAWIGKNVPLAMVKTTLFEAMKIYPYLSYFYVVGDRGETPPERVHNTIHIGGSIEAALVMKLKAFDQTEMRKALTGVTTIEELHRYLREMNRDPEPAAPTKSAPQ